MIPAHVVVVRNTRSVMEHNKPKVGVGVMVFKDGKILLGKRKGAHGEGEQAFPGGLLSIWNHLKIVRDERYKKSVVSRLKTFGFSYCRM